MPERSDHRIVSCAVLGAIGVVCQKVGEAEVMVEGGIKDILIPYNIVGPRKVERLTRLSRRATITVAVDSEDTARDCRAGAEGRMYRPDHCRTRHRIKTLRRAVA